MTAMTKELMSQIEAIRDTYRKAIEHAGFKVETASGNNDRCVMVITSTKVSERFFEHSFALTIETRYSSKVSLSGVYRKQNTTYGGRPRRYTKFDTNNLVHLLDMLRDGEAKAVSSAKAHAEAEADQAAREGTMVKELGGTIVPPCAEIKPILGNGPTAGKYAINVSRYVSYPLASIAMSAAQVKKLCALLNEIQGSDKLCIIQSHVGEHLMYWTDHGWIGSTPKVFPEAVAQEELAKAKADSRGNINPELIPYGAYAVIA